MPGKLNLYNIGQQGVNVDKNPIQLEDGEFTQAQNAITDDDGAAGSIRKRPGLIKHNSVAAAGSIRGAIGVPIGIGTAGNTGSTTPSPAVEPEQRSLFAGRRITSGTSGTTGWNTTTDLFATSITTGGPDGYDANATPRVPDRLWAGMAESGATTHKTRAFRSGRPGVMFQNRFYYAGNNYTHQSTNPTIRMWDGSKDYQIATVPSRAGTITEGVQCMIVGGDEYIYFTTHDTGVYSANTLKARVFQLDPHTGGLTQMGSLFPISPETVRVPYDLAWHQGRLWTRTHGGGITATSQLVYYFRPGIDTDWTSESLSAIAATAFGCTTMLSFQGQLYMGTGNDQSSNAAIQVRSTQGVYSTSKTVAGADASPSFVTAGYANHFGSMAVFGNALYAAYYTQAGNEADTSSDRFIRIYKYDGSSWTVVYNPAANDTSAVPYSGAFVYGGKLYFVSATQRHSAADANVILYTANGSSWTTVSGVLDDSSVGILGAIAT